MYSIQKGAAWKIPQPPLMPDRLMESYSGVGVHEVSVSSWYNGTKRDESQRLFPFLPEGI
jgi:hypothetical protein